MFSYVRAWACLLRFTGLSVEITDEKMEKSKFSEVKWSSRNEGFGNKKGEEDW